VGDPKWFGWGSLQPAFSEEMALMLRHFCGTQGWVLSL